MTLGKRLRRLRGKRTQQDIGDKLGISRARYSHYETDHVQPDHELLYKMANIYDVSIDYLLGRDSAAAAGLSEEEIEIIERLRRLGEKDVAIILSMIERLENKG